jgi:Fe-S cluster assembly protein SufD
MQQQVEDKDYYLAAHPEFLEALGPGQPPWLDELRGEGLEHFEALGFPHPRLEEWRYTNVAPFTQIPFRPAPLGAPSPRRETLPAYDLGGIESVRLAFVNGRFSPDLSELGGLPGGVTVGPLSALLASRPELLEEHLSLSREPRGNAFTALNTAFLEDGAAVVLPPGAEIERPIHLLYLSIPGEGPLRSHPRTLVVAGAGSRATVLECYAGPEGGLYFTNPLTQIEAAEEAAIEHLKIQRESEDAFHVGAVHIRQKGASSVSSLNYSVGGAMARTDVRVSLDAEGASSELDGLYLARHTQHADTRITVDHAVPRCSSRELYKGILAERGKGIFNGRIIVRPDAQQTEASQSSKALLLSDDVEVHAQPQLEIHADDVKCSHGSTVGRLDEDALFYLRSRGLAAAEARRLLTLAFASEVLTGVSSEPLRRRLENLVHERLTDVAAAGGGPS